LHAGRWLAYHSTMRLVLALVTILTACGGSSAHTTVAPPRTRAPNGQWTAEDIATFERLATGRAGTAIDIDHLTPTQLASVAGAIRALHARAEPDGHEERRALLLWAVGTTQVHIVVSARAGEVAPSRTDHPYLLELTLALAASVIETPDGTEQQLRALQGLLTYYEAARRAGATDQPMLDALVADRDAGRLGERAAEQAHGIGAGSVDPVAP